MKKLLSLTVAVLLGIGTMFANPVDVTTAKALGQKYVLTNFEQTRGANLQLVYTFSAKNETAFYVFDVDDNGFVIVSADDMFRPIVGYGKGETFDTTNPEMMFYLNALASGRSLDRNKVSDVKVMDEWESLRKYGRLLSYNRGKVVDYLVQTKWNQNPAPYNSMCPADPSGPGGHVYVGCVATAMAQIMKYWNYPTTGQSSHSYYCPGYGTQTANFGATTYDWDNMLNSYGQSYTPEQGNAVALLSYHCGVSVDMHYAVDGSGTSSAMVPDAIKQYFRYSTAANIQYKGNLAAWLTTLKSGLDKGWPMYYSGSEPEADAGHAFICDGYDDEDYFHFNWGWAGSGDNWFLVGDIDYSAFNATITNFVPTDVYNNAPQAPSNIQISVPGDLAQQATVTWTNPTQTLNYTSLSTIEAIVLTRNGKVIQVYDNATPGASMTYTDEHVPCYSTFDYVVYAVNSGVKGNSAKVSYTFGPKCQWTIIATATEMQGWKDGKITAYDGAGRAITSFTMTNNQPSSTQINMIIGTVRFAWKKGTDDVTLSFKIKDSTGAIVYEFAQGSSADIPSGYFYVGNNSCGNAAPTEVPGELFAQQDGDNIILSWSGDTKDIIGFNVYRDGYLFELAHGTEFVDEDPGVGGHCYQVCYLSDGGESEFSNEACANAGDNCEPPTELYYEVQNNFKPIIYWTIPEEGQYPLTGFYVYRKTDDTDYSMVKLLGPNKTEYKETKTLVNGTWYYYRVVAYYQDIDCYSAPAKYITGNQYYVKYYYSNDGMEENLTEGVSIYPNPTKDMITVKADNLSSVEVYNTIGQKVFSQTLNDNETVINMSDFEAGIYMVRIVADGNEITRKISVVK